MVQNPQGRPNHHHHQFNYLQTTLYISHQYIHPFLGSPWSRVSNSSSSWAIWNGIRPKRLLLRHWLSLCSQWADGVQNRRNRWVNKWVAANAVYFFDIETSKPIGFQSNLCGLKTNTKWAFGQSIHAVKYNIEGEFAISETRHFLSAFSDKNHMNVYGLYTTTLYKKLAQKKRHLQDAKRYLSSIGCGSFKQLLASRWKLRILKQAAPLRGDVLFQTNSSKSAKITKMHDLSEICSVPKGICLL